MKNCRDSLPEAWGPWERQHAAPALQYPVSKIWIAGYWFWSRLSYIASASNQRRVVQIQLLASVGWKWGCQPFSWRCLQNVTHCRKEIWSPRFCTIQWLCRRFGLQDIDWLCSQLWHVTAANQWTVVEIELLATVGWKWVCHTFSCPWSENVTFCRKEIWSPRFLRYSDYVQDLDYRILIACALSCDMWRLPTNEQWSKLILQQQWVGSGAARLSWSENVTYCRKEIWSPRFLWYSDYVQDLDYRILIACALSCDMWLLQTDEQLSRFSF